MRVVYCAVDLGPLRGQVNSTVRYRRQCLALNYFMAKGCNNLQRGISQQI